jgi:hypothetical protein
VELAFSFFTENDSRKINFYVNKYKVKFTLWKTPCFLWKTLWKTDPPCGILFSIPQAVENLPVLSTSFPQEVSAFKAY